MKTASTSLYTKSASKDYNFIYENENFLRNSKSDKKPNTSFNDKSKNLEFWKEKSEFLENEMREMSIKVEKEKHFFQKQNTTLHEEILELYQENKKLGFCVKNLQINNQRNSSKNSRKDSYLNNESQNKNGKELIESKFILLGVEFERKCINLCKKNTEIENLKKRNKYLEDKLLNDKEFKYQSQNG